MAETRDEYLRRLDNELGKAVAAGEFVNSAGGKILLDFIQNDIQQFTANIAGDKFINDHSGYLNDRARLSYAMSLHKRLTRLSDPDLPKAIGDQITLAKSDDEEEPTNG
jgi:hypothetical protein